jgi:mono/diheme cytochrome c family protein/uncharacterized membrane protein
MALAASLVVLSVVVTDLPRAPAAPPDGPGAASLLYRENCQRCHGADGKGDGKQADLPDRPDFTRGAWQEERGDAQLAQSILDGKGKGMPPFRDVLGETRVRSLVAHVRAFGPAAKPERDFDSELRRLQKELADLKKQLKEQGPEPAHPGKPASDASKGSWEAGGTAEDRRGAAALYREHCRRCHGADGKGRQEESPEDVPDFSLRDWQARRSDTQLLQSILDGKGKKMPPWRDKVTEDQARGLVAYVRGFAPAGVGAGRGGRQQPPPDLEERQRRLNEKLGELQKQLERLSPAPPEREPAKPPETSPPAAAAVTPAAREQFRKHCAKCHGADGTGSPARDRLPALPDFTDASWQTQQEDARLLAGILDGKGKEMPPWRDKISEEQARGLVTRVRAFAPAADSAGREEGAGPSSAGPADDGPPKGFSEKMGGWLGNFHPAAVHFPIALLVAAAVAVVLRLATGRPAFDAVARYCLWFGALTAVVAGTLGWFCGGARLADAYWVMMAHRWLGTAVVASAGLALLLGEVSRRPDRHRTRACFRVLLLAVAGLVLATGFFGGALLHGLGHYAWPQ